MNGIKSQKVELKTITLDPQQTYVFVVEKRVKSRFNGRVIISENRVGVYWLEHQAQTVCNSLNKDRFVGEVEYRVTIERLRGLLV